jgi:hypothetical protein
MHFHRFLVISALAAGLAAIAFADDDGNKNQNGNGSGSGGGTTTATTQEFVFPPVTLSATETAQVNVVNNAPPATGTNPAPSCIGNVVFVLSSTATPPAAAPFSLGAGQFFTASLPFSKLGVSTPLGEVVAKIELTVTTGSNVPCSLGASEVVVDTTSGATHAVVTATTTATGGAATTQKKGDD